MLHSRSCAINCSFPWRLHVLDSRFLSCDYWQTTFVVPYKSSAPTTHRKHVTWRLASQSIGVLAAAYKKHASRDSYPLLRWRHCTCAEVFLSSRCLETGCITPLFYCRVRILRSLPGNGFACHNTIVERQFNCAVPPLLLIYNVQALTEEYSTIVRLSFQLQTSKSAVASFSVQNTYQYV
jgi:hypothetical protein